VLTGSRGEVCCLILQPFGATAALAPPRTASRKPIDAWSRSIKTQVIDRTVPSNGTINVEQVSALPFSEMTYAILRRQLPGSRNPSQGTTIGLVPLRFVQQSASSRSRSN